MINVRRHINDNGFVSNYWYDADGERTVKTSGEGEQVYVNSLFSGGNTQTAKFSLYVNPYLVASQGGRYTKHIYIGSQRIVSKLGDLQSYGADPRRIPYAGSESDNITVDYKGKYQKQQQVIKDNYATFEVPYNGLDNDNYVDGDGFCCSDNRATTRSLNPGQNDNYERAQFYYHPDHLGSSSFITNLDGDVAQHIEYVPFGEVFIEERNNVWNTPYLFNAKELDEETGLYYYGARYYNPRISLWLSVDPLADQAPGWTPYRAFFNNPIRYIDPDGLFEIETGKIEKGDNLMSIAKQLNDKFKTNLTVADIAKANNIKDINKIKTGDFIKLPGADIELNFDLNSLKVSDVNYSVDIPDLEWKGTSGREGYQNPESQNLKDKGPIPEGQYKVDPDRTQSISDISSWDRFKGNFGGGTWPGLEKSWGEHRTWLTPMGETNTFGRSGFTIHGGALPGSAGCIDLTGRNNSFHSWLKSHGKPIMLNVKYPTK